MQALSCMRGGVSAVLCGVTTDASPRLQTTLEDRYSAPSGEVMLSGIQSLVRITLEQRRLDERRGLKTGLFVSGYEGSPLGGLDMEMSRASSQLESVGVVFRPGVNEELAATAVSGTQSLGLFPGRRVDGVTGCWYGKNPGLDRAADAIRHGNLSGTAPLGGAVAWIGDDPASKSSTVPSSCVPMCRNLVMPVLAPSTVEEMLSLGLHAIAMSRYAGLWVGMQIVTDIADATDTVDLDRALSSVVAVELEPRGDFEPVMMLPPGNLDAELDLMQNRLARASTYARAANLNHVTFEPTSPRLALVGVGFGYQAITRALEELGIDERECDRLGIRTVQLAMPWPLDGDDVVRLCGDAETVLVVEDKLAFVEVLIRDALYRREDSPVVLGKFDALGANLLPMRAFLTADDVARALGRIDDVDQWSSSSRSRLASLQPRQRISLKVASPSTRTPYFCSGCPHNISTRAASDQLVGVGIGCHSLANMDSGDRRGHLTGITQMGGEGAQWFGLSPFTDDPHFIQNIGDGTFHHSGSLAIRAAVASGVTMTYKLLYNNAVAMTGGQQPQGKLDVPALTQLLKAEGVKRVVITTPEPEIYDRIKLSSIASVRHRDELQEAQLELAEVSGVTVLLHDDRCAAEKRRLRKRGQLEMPAQRVVINERVCEGCGDCGEKSTCLSLVPVPTEFGRKTQVHQSSCNIDMSCVKGDCPSFLLVTPNPRKKPTRSTVEPPSTFPAPVMRVPSNVLIRLPGVGGTGVVTVSAILQMAAYLDGKYAAGLDQIGLAQKGGPVVSDVRLGTIPVKGQLRASARSADVILGFDVLGAASDDTLGVADAERTVAILNSSVTPTAAMVTDVNSLVTGTDEYAERVDRVTRSGENVRADAGGLAEALFGDHFAANMILLGVAFQHGCLPVSGEAIEKAIGLNGAAVDANIRAFRWGRAMIAAPNEVTKALSPTSDVVVVPSAATVEQIDRYGFVGEIRDAVALRFGELVAYQGHSYAENYVADVARVHVRASEALELSADELSLGFAKSLFKLMAYKDEYEVARLHLVERARVRSEYGNDATIKVLLHPPMLRAMGWKKKIHLRRTAYPTFKVLYALRRVRGTKLDPFGYAHVRRVERELIREYRTFVNEALQQLTADNLSDMIALVELPDVIRGYESIKMANIEIFRSRAAVLSTQMTVAPATS